MKKSALILASAMILSGCAVYPAQPVAYVAPAPVYVPPPVYVAPAPVYVPPPVYVAPAPVYVPPPVVVVRPYQPRRYYYYMR